jgi:hypothetical protein
MATFKCVQTGNTVEFNLEHDIRTMRQHPEYTEVIEKVKQEEKPVKKPVVKSKAE